MDSRILVDIVEKPRTAACSWRVIGVLPDGIGDGGGLHVNYEGGRWITRDSLTDRPLTASRLTLAQVLQLLATTYNMPVYVDDEVDGVFTTAFQP